jgi:glycosyltransferase involved in cell wall biosynthesis
VLAIVPHYQCDAWLGDCLDSLVRQTRPLDGIVVIDDGSGSPPTDIVRQFPAVTLLASAENVGPYRLTQAVIDQTDYDAFLLQDADDWSAPTRLHLLLAAAERTGAELIGCQAYRVIYPQLELKSKTYPLDVNAALAAWPTWYALLHPTSLVSRDLVVRIGGYATGLKFGGDREFQASLARGTDVKTRYRSGILRPQRVHAVRGQPRSRNGRPCSQRRATRFASHADS